MQCHAIPCNNMQYHAIPSNTIQYHPIPCNTLQYHATPCSTMQYHAIPCSTMQYCASVQYHAIPCNTMQYHVIPSNTIQYHPIPCNTMQYHAIPCNNMQYNAIPCNTMQYHASLITADRAYHCPVGSIRSFFWNWSHPIKKLTGSAIKVLNIHGTGSTQEKKITGSAQHIEKCFACNKLIHFIKIYWKPLRFKQLKEYSFLTWKFCHNFDFIGWDHVHTILGRDHSKKHPVHYNIPYIYNLKNSLKFKLLASLSKKFPFIDQKCTYEKVTQKIG